MNKWTVDVAALLLRLTAAAIFLPHGYAKVFGKGGVAAFAADLPSYHLPTFLGYIAAYAEFAGGILLIVGLLSRLAAFLLACSMFVVAFVIVLPDALHDAPTLLGITKAIELPLSLMAITLAIVFLGSGRLSLDRLVVWKKPGTWA
jgi:putative oxidoreductase